MDEIEEAIAEIETDLSIKPGFFADLKKDEDWAFLIKTHALLESVCSHLLTSFFEDPKFKDIFSRLEMSDSKTGKVAFLRAAGLIAKEQARFIRGLSELRNDTVHTIQGIHFTFAEHIEKLDKQQREAFIDTFGYAYTEEDENGNNIISARDLVLSDPKKAIWLGVTYILAIVKAKVDTRKFEEQVRQSKLKIFEIKEELSDNSTE